LLSKYVSGQSLRLDFGRPVAPLYTLEDLKRHVFNLQGSGIGDDLKQSTPAVCGFKSSPV
jgi:hypothetical protein